jgi:formiminotetrahydrofolate cyclodeaminase/Zn-dependent peptidase ImmA (M78 family)
MDIELIKLPTETLLGKFGVGNHIPGSGSAAALQGLLSAQLISTVINLTSEKKRNDYQLILPQLKHISSEINVRIYPRLQELFQQDSEQFDFAIQLRKARDNEKKIKKSKELDQQAQVALKFATETLIEVAKLCVELGDFATLIFNKAFRSARGDSGVALNGAIAAVAGCLSIINLNLLSIDDRSWIDKVKLSTVELKLHYERLLLLANDSLTTLEKEVEINQSLKNEIKRLQANKLNNQNLSNRDIENVAKEIQNILWRYRNTIWKKKTPETPREVLKPHTAIVKLLNYKIVKRESLGFYNIYGDSVEVAGIIDNDNKAIGISEKFSNEIQNFTLAHELGHAILHEQTGLHRDKAIGDLSVTREPIELQADKFATYFLMPKKQIKEFFKEIFFMEKFTLNEDNVFALTGGSLTSFRFKCKNQRELSRIISSAESFYGAPFKSMAEVFNVSIEAMAIRLEELGLVEFESFVSVNISL